jgi:NADH:ubiquinone oxidoreductase subunit K
MTPSIDALAQEMLPFGLAAALLAIGVACLLTQQRVIKQIIGLNIMLQGALVVLLDAGLAHDALSEAQGIIISALVVEAIAFSIGLALVVNVHRYHPEGRVDDLTKLRG